MGIGIGILLIVVGLIIIFALNFNLPYLSDTSLGVILIVVGVLAIILTFLIHAQRSRSRHTTETHIDGGNTTTDQQVQRQDPPGS